MIRIEDKKTFFVIALILLLQLPVMVLAAPSSVIYFPEIGDSSANNILETGKTSTVTISFKNTAGADISDIASTIQYITIAAANLNPDRTSIELEAQWKIYYGATSRTSGSVTGERSSEIYSPYSTVMPIELYVWRLGPPNISLANYTYLIQFSDDLRILRPGEILNLTVTINCLNKVGDTVIWFFLKASEDEHQEGSYPALIAGINDRCNLYYSKLPGGTTKYWLPLHNSYDPYDEDLETGHSFRQHSWTREPTLHAFAKANKHVHQKLAVDPPPPEVFTFHICGVKFLDNDRNSIWEMGIDQPVDGIKLWLLAKAQDGRLVPADGADSPYYGIISVIEEHGNPVLSGEEGETVSGHYCFNLNVNKGGTYEFYIWLDESTLPPNYWVYPAIEDKDLIINSTLIGPITLTTGDSEVSYGNSFANHLLPVGGKIIKQENMALKFGYTLIVVIGSIGIICITITREKSSKILRKIEDGEIANEWMIEDSLGRPVLNRRMKRFFSRPAIAIERAMLAKRRQAKV